MRTEPPVGSGAALAGTLAPRATTAAGAPGRVDAHRLFVAIGATGLAERLRRVAS